jgi:hypothetical protein
MAQKRMRDVCNDESETFPDQFARVCQSMILYLSNINVCPLFTQRTELLWFVV